MNRCFIAFCCSLTITAAAAQKSTPGVVQTPPSIPQNARSPQAKLEDDFIYNIYAKTYQDQDQNITNFETAFFDKVENPYPYIYALWFNQAVLGPYGKKDDAHQIHLMKRILQDPHAQGTIKAAAYYQKGMHHMFSHNFDSANAMSQNVGSLRNWQYVGPFENISHSGFHKNFGPLEHPESKAEFISSTNAKIKWFSPSYEIQDGWTAICKYIYASTGVIYAQTFVNSPTDQEVYCNAGGSGALKIWINDALIFSDETERVTELDTYTIRTKLQKGVNRILVQTSFTDSDYPNFIIRLTDKNYTPLPGLTGSTVHKPYVKATTTQATVEKHFAEAFFQEKIAADPGNPLNYLLLGDVYQRNRKLNEAHELIETALEKNPENTYLRMKFIDILGKENNRTRMLEELSKLRQIDPNSLLCLEVDIKLHTANQQWEDALQKIERRISEFGETVHTQKQKLEILYKQKKYQEFVSLAEKLYTRYPDNAEVNRMMFSIKRDVNRDIAGALGIYEKYLINNYDYNLLQDYSRSLIANGQVAKGTGLVEQVIKDFPFEAFVIANFSDYNFTTKDYAKAEKLILDALKIAPYNEDYWSKLGDIKREQQKTTEAIEAYNKSLSYDPNQYQVINKLRLLKGLSESHKLIPDVNVDKLIQEKTNLEAAATDAGYITLLDERNIIIHPSGAFQEFDNYIVKIVNETGIEEFKESDIRYGGSQSLLIELAEVIKPSGAHIRAERNENHIVFTNLEIGDVIVFKYNYKNYVTGRFADQYWEKIYFANGSPVAHQRFSLLVPAAKKFNYTWNQSPVKPTVKDIEDFKQYTWEANNIAGVNDEPFMPATVDIVPVLHISTLNKWQEISNWYSDIANQPGSENYEVKAVLKKLFTDDELKTLNQLQKARRIYEYILTNIRYSSVSFRQGAFVPQPAFTTLSTRLGDCKDLSNLFITLCQMVGIEGRMVLVNTHDNGERDMLLPSIDFNHCIAKVQLDKKDYYIELTDRYLPFTSVPNSLINSSILEIPRKNEVFVSELKKLYPPTKAKDVVKTTLTIKPEGSDLVVNSQTTKYGHLSSALRGKYSELSPERRLKTLEETVASYYKSNITIEDIGTTTNIDNLADSSTVKFTYRVKDEIAEIGSMRTFKVHYPDVIGALAHFPSNTRIFPINYNAYEDTDFYETRIHINLPEGKKFLEVPADENITFRGMTYTLKFKTVSPGKLEITRTFNSNRNSIPAEEYAAFKSFIEKVVKAESKMIAYQ